MIQSEVSVHEPRGYTFEHDSQSSTITEHGHLNSSVVFNVQSIIKLTHNTTQNCCITIYYSKLFLTC